jgi:hypothetical protein
MLKLIRSFVIFSSIMIKPSIRDYSYAGTYQRKERYSDLVLNIFSSQKATKMFKFKYN